MALDTRIPLGVQQVDIASPLANLIQTRQNTQDRATAAQDREREIARQAEQDRMRNTEFAQNTELNQAKIDEFRNNATTKKYMEDTLTVKNLLESGNARDAALVVQGMQERFKGTDYANGLDADFSNIVAGNLEPVLSGINSEVKAFEEMQRLASGRTQAQDPSALQIYDRVSGMTPEEQELFFRTQRGATAVNLGDRVVIPSQVDPAGAPQAEFQRGVSPDAQPALRGEQTAAVQAAEIAAIAPRAEAEREATLTANQGARAGALSSKEDQFGLLSDLVDVAKSQSGTWTTGFIGAAASRVPGTPAYDLSQTLETLKASAGFETLQEMRDNSPTGGALGQVTERELALLQATWGSLQQSQSQSQFEANLDRFNRQLQQSWDRVNRAYERDYGQSYFDQGSQPAQSQQPQDDIFSQADAIINGL